MHEGEGFVVAIAMKNGEEYRGTLSEAEDTMNCQLKEGNFNCLLRHFYFLYFLFFIVTLTGRDGRITKLEQVYLRGGQIKFIVLPDALKQSPIFKKVQQLSRQKKERELTAGRGGRGGGRGAKRTK